MIKGSCPCGGVVVTAARRPDYLNSCDCSLCFRLGTLTGYFDPSEVTIDGPTKSFVRNDIDPPCLAVPFCPACGATVGWTSLEPIEPPRMGRGGDRRTSCPVPRSESTTSAGWASKWRGKPVEPTLARFNQTLQPAQDFNGRVVQEKDAGGGTDSCHFDKSAFDPELTLSKGTWTVGPDNMWGADNVGWISSDPPASQKNVITYYRTHNRAPCGLVHYQQMTMQCADGKFHDYGPVNALDADILPTKIKSIRTGVSISKKYP